MNKQPSAYSVMILLGLGARTGLGHQGRRVMGLLRRLFGGKRVSQKDIQRLERGAEQALREAARKRNGGK